MATSINSSGITFPDSTTQTTAGIGVASNVAIFTSGSGTWTAPTGVNSIYIILIGGGGGGATTVNGCGVSDFAGGGGGAGGFISGYLSVTPGTGYSYSVGAGGAGATTYNTNGSSGSSTTFGSNLTAAGGGGGTKQQGTSSSSGSNGVAGTGGAITYASSGIWLAVGSGPGQSGGNGGWLARGLCCPPTPPFSVASGGYGQYGNSSTGADSVTKASYVTTYVTGNTNFAGTNCPYFGGGGSGAFVFNNYNSPARNTGGNGGSGAIVIFY
jgi:hypothetical protein